MLAAIARKLFGSANDRVVRSLQPIVDAVNAAEPAVANLSDAELQARSATRPLARGRAR